jgi:two-component system chemotaxis response regulator CheB
LRLERRCIVIGISTGGPPALARLFEALEPPLPPILVAQHMPEKFTGPFAARLNGLSQLTICEAGAGDRVAPNHVWVAPGGKHLRVVRTPRGCETRISDDPPVSGHRPSVDVLMTSAAEAYGDQCLGVIMTGMGYDGVEGCAAIRRAGGYVLGQDQETSDVYGMNKAAFRAGHVHEQFALGDLPELVVQLGRAEGWAGRSAHICSH